MDSAGEHRQFRREVEGYAESVRRRSQSVVDVLQAAQRRGDTVRFSGQTSAEQFTGHVTETGQDFVTLHAAQAVTHIHLTGYWTIRVRPSTSGGMASSSRFRTFGSCLRGYEWDPVDVVVHRPGGATESGLFEAVSRDGTYIELAAGDESRLLIPFTQLAAMTVHPPLS